MKKKAQAGMEFISVFVVFLALFVALQAYYWQELENTRVAEAGIYAKGIARGLGAKINLVARQEGASADFFVPPALPMGETFVLRVSNYSVEIDWELGKSAVEPIQAARAVNATEQQPFAMAAGNYWINHSNGGVVISAK